MPCRCDDMPHDRRPEQMLCAVLSVLDGEGTLADVLVRIDWEEAGIRRSELESWWDAHKEADRKRRETEAFNKRRDALRQSAITKMTPDERRALGLAG